MPTLDGISYTEPMGSNTGQTSRDAISRTRMFDVDWADKGAFVRALLGGTTVTGGEYDVTWPQRYAPGSILFAKSARFKGLGAPGLDSDDLMKYAKARFTVQYAPLEAEDEEGDDDQVGVWADETMQFKTQMLQLPKAGLRWDTDDVKLDEEYPAAIPVVFADITLTRYNVGVLPRSSFIAACGKVNSDTFRGYAAGTLLFAGWSYSYSIDTEGTRRKYTVTVGMKFKAKKWRFMWRPGVGWRKVERADGGDLFETTNFGNL